ncbi:hypothetical protein C4E44_28800 [Pseudomonas sp. MWU12-2312b]|nr:hypothetical protein C4E44_28800 [Pseudomonas sp. MWU12-2312b]
MSNGANRPALDLPAEKTRSIFKTQTSPGGRGFNELRIEDRKGAEEISIRAQRDYRQHVLNDERVQVDNQRSVVVAGNARHEQRAEERRITHGDRRTEVRQDDHLTVQGSRYIRAASHRLSAQQQVNVSANQNIVIDGGASTTIQAGGVWITINAAGIFSSVPVEVGGVPKPVIAATPVMLDASEPPLPDAISTALLKRLLGDEALIELCQMPAGGTPMDCPLSDCQCRKALGYGDRT